MYLKKVAITNFRIFCETGIVVEFNKGVNAIIGENNSGKSAIIDAIRIAFSTIPYNKDIYFTKSDFHIDYCGQRAKTAQIDIFLDEVPIYLIEIWNPEEPSTGEFHLRFYTEITTSGFEKVKYRAWGGKIEGNSLSAETFDTMNIAFLGALRDAGNEMRPSRTSKLAQLLSSIATDETTRNALVNELQEANRTILSMKPIQRTKEIINHNLSDIEQNLFYQQVDVGLVDPKFDSIASSLRAWIVPRWYYIENKIPQFKVLSETCQQNGLKNLYQRTDTGTYFDINGILKSGIQFDKEILTFLQSLINHSFELQQNGLGYNNLLFMSAVLGDMSLEKEGNFLNLFAIEEPEAHLHPQLQELVHSFLVRKHHTSELIQIIYTSHSPTLVSRIGIDAINLLYEDCHSINCYPLARTNLEQTDKDYLEKYLDVTKSQMFFAKGIVFVEGISEALLLPEFAKSLERPLDVYAIEVVNVDGTSFKPFVNLLSSLEGKKCFTKAAIITDDDRCTDKSSENYITKDLDYDSDLAEIPEKIKKGSPSYRFKKIEALCSESSLVLCVAKKTFEYELALHENNIPYLINAIKNVFPEVGISLETKVNQEQTVENKALRIWLFIRTRDKNKGQIAQELCRIIKDLKHEKPFVVPQYIAKAIYAVTKAEE